MKVCDLPADREPEPCSGWLCGEEGLKDLCSDRGINTSALVDYADDHAASSRPGREVFCLDTDTPRNVYLTVDDVREWESEHGALPDGGWLLYRTGWDSRAASAASESDTSCVRCAPTRRAATARFAGC